MDRAKPLYLANTPGNIFFSWFGVAGNIAAVLWTTHWLVEAFPAVQPPWYLLAVTVLAGLFLLDWFSGLLHWAYDTWFDEGFSSFERSVCIAREHHVLPYNIVGYGARDHLSYSCWPALALLAPGMVWLTLREQVSTGAYLGTLLCAIVCGGMIVASYCHIAGHRPARSRLVRGLQRMGLLITPTYHRVHHSAGHDVRYGVVNGWSNVITDRIGFWRGMEWLIQTLTGAQPRRSDREWMIRFGRREA